MQQKKQVFEIAWHLCKNVGKPTSCAECSVIKEYCPYVIKANDLYSVGIRKHSETCIEIPCVPGGGIYILDCYQIYKERVVGVLITTVGIDIVTRRGSHPAEEIGDKLFFDKDSAQRRLEMLDKEQLRDAPHQIIDKDKHGRGQL